MLRAASSVRVSTVRLGDCCCPAGSSDTPAGPGQRPPSVSLMKPSDVRDVSKHVQRCRTHVELFEMLLVLRLVVSECACSMGLHMQRAKGKLSCCSHVGTLRHVSRLSLGCRALSCAEADRCPPLRLAAVMLTCQRSSLACLHGSTAEVAMRGRLECRPAESAVVARAGRHAAQNPDTLLMYTVLRASSTHRIRR